MQHLTSLFWQLPIHQRILCWPLISLKPPGTSGSTEAMSASSVKKSSTKKLGTRLVRYSHFSGQTRPPACGRLKFCLLTLVGNGHEAEELHPQQRKTSSTFPSKYQSCHFVWNITQPCYQPCIHCEVDNKGKEPPCYQWLIPLAA